jgi:putative transposase
VVEAVAAPLAPAEKAVGIDLGLTFAALSDGREYKANLYGRTLVRVDRRFPSSQRCSACGHHDGPKPLKVRTWTCPYCGTVHDRDLNAAKNILAAGLAVTACGPGVRLSASQAVGDEAGTTLAGAA